MLSGRSFMYIKNSRGPNTLPRDKVDYGILLLKLREIGISGNLGIWFYNFLAHRSQYVRLPGGVSDDSMVDWLALHLKFVSVYI